MQHWDLASNCYSDIHFYSFVQSAIQPKSLWLVLSCLAEDLNARSRKEHRQRVTVVTSSNRRQYCIWCTCYTCCSQMSDMRVAALKLDEDRWRFHIPIHSWCLSLVVCFANSCVIVSSRTISNGQTLSELCDWTLQPGQPVHLLSCKQKDSQSPLAVYEFAITIWWLRISPSMTEIVLETANFSATRLRFVVRNAFTKNATLRFGLKLLLWYTCL